MRAGFKISTNVKQDHSMKEGGNAMSKNYESMMMCMMMCDVRGSSPEMVGA
jgi:hypothetical protein